MKSENHFDFKPLDRGLGFNKNADSPNPLGTNTPNRSIGIQLPSEPGPFPTGINTSNRDIGDIGIHTNRANVQKPNAKNSQKIDKNFSLEKLEFELQDEEPANSTPSHSIEKEPTGPDPSHRYFSPMNQEGQENSVSRSLKKMLDSLPPTFDFKEDKRAKRHKHIKGNSSLLNSSINKPAYGSQKTMETENPNQAPNQIPWTREWTGENRRKNFSNTVSGLEQTNQQDFDVTLGNSLSKAFPVEESLKPFHHQIIEPVYKYREMSSNFASGIIDSMVLLGLSSLFVISLILITKVDILAMLTNPKMMVPTLFDLGLLYVGVTLIYYMLSRGLFGSTLGDWAFDVQLGSDKERNHHLYPFQVVFRTLIIMATGVLFIPLVSLGFGKDIAYYFSGLKLYNRQY